MQQVLFPGEQQCQSEAIFSSVLITAVLRASFISSRSSDRHAWCPVRTFQHPSLRIRSFLFNFFFVLSGAIFTVHLLGRKSLSPTHPVRQMDCGRTAPYWLGAAQLEVDGSCPMSSEELSHRRKRPLAPNCAPIELRLITGNCRFPCCVYAEQRSWSDLSRAQAWAYLYGGPVVAHAAGPPLSTAMMWSK